MTHIFFDTEFSGLHKNTTLISLGMITDEGDSFYAEFTDYDKSQIDGWIQENVIDKLIMNDIQLKSDEIFYDKDIWNNVKIKGTKFQIKKQLIEWLGRFDEIQLISDVCHYDMALFIDIFGTAFDLPSNISPTCHDINQDIAAYHQISERDAFDINREDFAYCGYTPDEKEKHNALWDAKVIQLCYDLIQSN